MSHYPRFSWLERGTVCREVAGSIPTKTPKIEDSNLSTKRFQHSYKTIFLRRDENNIDQCGTPPSGQSEAHAPGHFAERKLECQEFQTGESWSWDHSPRSLAWVLKRAVSSLDPVSLLSLCFRFCTTSSPLVQWDCNRCYVTKVLKQHSTPEK